MIETADRIRELSRRWGALGMIRDRYFRTGMVEQGLIREFHRHFPDQAIKSLYPDYYYTQVPSVIGAGDVEGLIMQLERSLLVLTLTEYAALVNEVTMPDIKILHFDVGREHREWLASGKAMTEDLKERLDEYLNTPVLKANKIYDILKSPEARLLAAYCNNPEALKDLPMVLSKLPALIQAVSSNIKSFIKFTNHQLDGLDLGTIIPEHVEFNKLSYQETIDRSPERTLSRGLGKPLTQCVDSFADAVTHGSLMTPELENLTLGGLDSVSMVFDVKGTQAAIKEFRGCSGDLLGIRQRIEDMSIDHDVCLSFNELLDDVRGQLIGINRLVQLLPIFMETAKALNMCKIRLRAGRQSIIAKES